MTDMTNPLSLEPKGGYTPKVNAAAERELLELAAKAAGLPVEWDGRGFVIESMFRGHLANYDPWNPLEDDGDALRLAVKLRIDLDQWIHSDRVTAWNHLSGGISLTETPAPEIVAHHHEPRGADELSATRRAIVRAAAAIARATEA